MDGDVVDEPVGPREEDQVGASSRVIWLTTWN